MAGIQSSQAAMAARFGREDGEGVTDGGGDVGGGVGGGGGGPRMLPEMHSEPGFVT